MSAPVVHFEVLGQDAEKLHAFYGRLFDWKINADNPMKYGMVEAASDKSIGGGIGQAQEGGHVTFYVQVNDLQAYLDKAGKLGGKTIVPPTEIPDYVTFAMLEDPQGNMIGLVKE